VFEVSHEPPSDIAIVDDVVTTGATARVMAANLLEAGARHVEIWALARTPAQGQYDG
jgi:predicted amidophosphoribosyltransferase